MSILWPGKWQHTQGMYRGTAYHVYNTTYHGMRLRGATSWTYVYHSLRLDLEIWAGAVKGVIGASPWNWSR